MKKETKRLFLPGGGYFDLKMPSGTPVVRVSDQEAAMGATGEPVGWPWIAGGAVLGGVLTWLFLRLSK